MCDPALAPIVFHELSHLLRCRTYLSRAGVQCRGRPVALREGLFPDQGRKDRGQVVRIGRVGHPDRYRECCGKFAHGRLPSLVTQSQERSYANPLLFRPG